MFDSLRCKFMNRKSRQDAVEREKMERLDKAEAELALLQERANNAKHFLVERHGRNHWRESIAQMITGVN